MEANLTVYLKDDFNALCDIYQIKPEILIQNFIDSISLPEYYIKPDDEHRFANLFFQDYVQSYYLIKEEEDDIHIDHIQIIGRLMIDYFRELEGNQN